MKIAFNTADLEQNITKDHIPVSLPGLNLIGRTRPVFSFQIIKEMLSDPRVLFGLWLLKGPISWRTRFYTEEDLDGVEPNELVNDMGITFPFVVTSEDTEVAEFVKNNFTRFWINSSIRALKALEWGYSGSEVMYRQKKDGMVHFDTIRDLHSPDLQAVTMEGKMAGFQIRRIRLGDSIHNISSENDFKTGPVYVGFPKGLWHVQSRERHPFFGLSRLFGAHVPWWEQWSDGGYRDVRRLWFYKNAFQGGIMRYPPGVTKDISGNIVVNKDYAREIMEKMRSGGVLALPNTPLGEGGGTEKQWEYEPPISLTTPQGLLEYGASLRGEILEAIGIPPEVIESPGNQGFGSSSGREVPQMAFFAILQEIGQWLITDFDNQVMRPIVRLNFNDSDYEIRQYPTKPPKRIPSPEELAQDMVNSQANASSNNVNNS